MHDHERKEQRIDECVTEKVNAQVLDNMLVTNVKQYSEIFLSTVRELFVENECDDIKIESKNIWNAVQKLTKLLRVIDFVDVKYIYEQCGEELAAYDSVLTKLSWNGKSITTKVDDGKSIYDMFFSKKIGMSKVYDYTHDSNFNKMAEYFITSIKLCPDTWKWDRNDEYYFKDDYKNFFLKVKNSNVDFFDLFTTVTKNLQSSSNTDCLDNFEPTIDNIIKVLEAAEFTM